MAQEFCTTCGGTDLAFDNGVLVCNACGAQQEVFQEETEFRAGIDDTRGRRRAANSSTNQHTQATLLARKEEQAAQQLQTAALAYVRCLQQLLQAQAECLTTRFGVSSQVTSVLRQLWLSHLPSTGMLEPTPHQLPAAAVLLGAAAAAAADPDADTADDDEPQPPAAATQPGDTDQQRSAALVVPNNMQRLFWKLLHPQVTLQLCFLACALLRQPVTCYDVIGWALDAQLPYLRLPDIADRCLTEGESAALAPRCLEATVSLSPVGLLNSACQLAAHLNLELPHIPGDVLLLRQVQELGLPQVVLDVSLQLYCMYLTRTSWLNLAAITKPKTQVTPYVWLSAVLLVAMKLSYGLGNAPSKAHPASSKAAGPPGGWQAWAQGVMQRLPGLSNMLLGEQEVLALEPEAQQQYLQFCRHHMFAGNPTVPSMEDVHRLLNGWYEAAATQGSSSTGALAAAEEAKHAAQHSMDEQPSAAGSGGAAGAATYSLLAHGAPAAGTFRSYLLEPQLAAVVLVLCTHSRCSPGSLLDCVRVLEKEMVAVEAGVRVLKEMDSVA